MNRGTSAAAVRWPPFAHRGLHDRGRGRVENTVPAFLAAIEAQLGIECDLQPSRDGTPVVFHDATLDRLTLERGRVDARSAADLCAIAVSGSSPAAFIPTFDELLDLVEGRVPLLVEVKSDWSPPDPRFIGAIAAAAAGYSRRVDRAPHHARQAGEAAPRLMLMSFDPAIVAALAISAPGVPRGLVSGRYWTDDDTPWWPEALDDRQRASLRDLADFERIGASFVAYEAAGLPSARVAALRAKGNPVFAWTVRTRTERDIALAYADAVIAEGQGTEGKGD